MPEYLQQGADGFPLEAHVPLDPDNWTLITNAMAQVVDPGGTAPSAHLADIDFAGKTGSAQTIGNAAKERLGGGKQNFKDNGWFVGEAPRRNPEVIVAVLLEEGEHGYLAARVASQVVKAYVEKQRKVALLLAQGHTPGDVAKADLDKVDVPKNVIDRFSPPATTSPGHSSEKASLTTTGINLPGVKVSVANEHYPGTVSTGQ